MRDALNEYLGLEPVLLEAWQRHLTRKQVSASVRAACPKGIRRLSDSPSERVSNEPPIPDQITESGKKSVLECGVNPPFINGGGFNDEQKDDKIGRIEGQDKFYGTEYRSGFTQASVWIADASDLRGW